MASTGAIRAGRAFIEIFADDRALKKGLAAASKAMRSFGSTVSSLGRSVSSMGRNTLFGGITAALPMAAATKRFADFDDQMRTVKAVSQSTQEEFLRLTEVAKRLGATTSFTAVEVAGLMAELGRAGFTAQQIEAMTGAVLDLSRATGTDPVLTSGIMAATIRQFNLAATDATRVADGLTQAANSSFNSVESLGEALQYAGPVAADANLSLEETLAILGALGNVGIQGSEAGTALRRLLVLTQADAESMKKIFGVDALDAGRNARPLLDVLDEVNQATRNLPSGDRAKKFSDFFGLLGITAASAIGKNAVGAKELLVGIQQATGVAARTAQEMDAGLGGAFRRLMSAVEGVAIAFGEALAPHIDVIAGKLTEFAGVVTRVLEQNPDLAATIASVAAGAVALGAALLVAGPAIAGAGAALTLLGTAVATLASPVGLAAFVLAIAQADDAAIGLGNAATAMADLWNKGSSDVIQAVKGIRDAIAAGDFKGAFEILATGVELIWARVADKLQTGWEDLIKHLHVSTAQFIKDNAPLLTLAGLPVSFWSNPERVASAHDIPNDARRMRTNDEIGRLQRLLNMQTEQAERAAKAATAAAANDPTKGPFEAEPWNELIKKFVPPVVDAMKQVERTFSSGQFGGQLASQVFGAGGNQAQQIVKNTGKTASTLVAIERKIGSGKLV